MNKSKFTLSALTRSIDLTYPPHKALLTMSIGLFTVFLFITSQSQGFNLEALKSGLNAALSTILIWALIRELDPNHPPVALLAGFAGGVVTYVSGPLQALILVWLLLSTRFINRAPGLMPLPQDTLLILFISLFLSFYHPLILVFAALFFFKDAALPTPAHRSVAAGFLSLLLFVIGLSTGALVFYFRLPPPYIVIFIIAISLGFLLYSRHQTSFKSLSDKGLKLHPSRQKAASSLVLQSLTLISLTGGPSLVEGVLPLWIGITMVLLAAQHRLLGRLTHSLKPRKKSV
jgi:hypothetical protein